MFAFWLGFPDAPPLASRLLHVVNGGVVEGLILTAGR